MGLHKTQLTSLLAEKNEQILQLEAKIQAYNARTSHIQTRLLSTLDTLDLMQNTHAEELKSLAQEKRQLEVKLGQYVQIVKSAETERDDMRDAVLQLVEKVEISNDYSTWPHSQLHLTNFADIVKHPDTKNLNDSEQDLLSCAATMIETLRHERDTARMAHTRYKLESEARITALQAQISRREAELEFYVAHIGTDSPVPDSVHISVPDHEPISNEQAIRMLDRTTARNKALELEIKTLFQRLEHARLAPQKSISITQPLSRPNDTDVQQWHEVSTDGKHSGIPPLIRNPPLRQSASQFSPELPSSEDQKLPTRTACSPEWYIQRNEQPSPSQHHDDGNTTIRKIQNTDESDHDQNLVAVLEYQIKELSKKIEAFKAERKGLLQFIAKEQIVTNIQLSQVNPTTPDERLAAIEEECNRLRKSEHILLGDFNALKLNAQARERQLLYEIEVLRVQLSGLMTQRLTGSEDLLDLADGEMSMELATPLPPTSMVLSHSLSSPRPLPSSKESSIQVDPPSPLVSVSSAAQITSPPYDHVASLSPALPILIGPMRSLANLPQSSAEANMERLEMDLAAAQRQLQEGEIALDELQNVLRGIHLSESDH
ncbi:hypothetical protein BDQ12DRAFT_63224 [Crucibulum laeve]|uniref:Uncharacterized protein n=1 Tax=Crucibulum laeve TaxID=68775 RepID=A0A5C3M4U4_9AGAR|nr:hypothetical protein BDQ12DRAFT_63224 [Crucibulum laeve]